MEFASTSARDAARVRCKKLSTLLDFETMKSSLEAVSISTPDLRSFTNESRARGVLRSEPGLDEALKLKDQPSNEVVATWRHVPKVSQSGTT